MSAREQAQILAALRHWQQTVERGEIPRAVEILEVDGHEPMTVEEIDALCDRLIFAEEIDALSNRLMS